MVHILDGNKEIGGYVRSNPCYLICLRRQMKSSQKSDFFLFREKLFSEDKKSGKNREKKIQDK